jgi:hypothetical protein
VRSRRFDRVEMKPRNLHRVKYIGVFILLEEVKDVVSWISTSNDNFGVSIAQKRSAE